jgi:hypothetical protein
MKLTAQQAFDRLSKLANHDQDAKIDDVGFGDEIDLESSIRNNREAAKDLFFGAVGGAAIKSYRELRERDVAAPLAGLISAGLQLYTTIVAPISFGIAVHDLLQANKYAEYGKIIADSGEDFPVV